MLEGPCQSEVRFGPRKTLESDFGALDGRNAPGPGAGTSKNSPHFGVESPRARSEREPPALATRQTGQSASLPFPESSVAPPWVGIPRSNTRRRLACCSPAPRSERVRAVPFCSPLTPWAVPFGEELPLPTRRRLACVWTLSSLPSPNYVSGNLNASYRMSKEKGKNASYRPHRGRHDGCPGRDRTMAVGNGAEGRDLRRIFLKLWIESIASATYCTCCVLNF